MARRILEELASSRLSFQENLELVPLPGVNGSFAQGDGSRKFMSTRAAWLPASDLRRLGQALTPDSDSFERDLRLMPKRPPAAYGGHVYTQAALAGCRLVEDEEKTKGVTEERKKLGLHTIHGYWNSHGQTDRPFIYTVMPMSQGRSFQTYLVHAHQPLSPSTSPSGDHYPLADAGLPLAPSPCFTALLSFKLPESNPSGVVVQAPSVQERFSSILGTYRPEDFPPSPPLDIDAITAMVGTEIVGTFPIVEMRKADLADWNASRPVHERRELIFYRLLKPLPSTASANEHVLVHAFESDRNGLLMIGNHLGYGSRFNAAASLSYSIVVHVDASEAVLDGATGEGWWVQETSWPRTGAGRATMEVKIWSPRGVHVATGLQDGLCKGEEAKVKL